MNISLSTFGKYEVDLQDNSRTYPVYQNEELVALKRFQFDPKQYNIRSLTGNSILPLYCEFFGQRLFKTGGRDIIITDSEMDCMRVYEALGQTVPVVSSLFGTVGLSRQYLANKEFLDSFENVYLFQLEEDKDFMKDVLPELPRITIPSF
jgi:hypothetical protein